MGRSRRRSGRSHTTEALKPPVADPVASARNKLFRTHECWYVFPHLGPQTSCQIRSGWWVTDICFDREASLVCSSIIFSPAVLSPYDHHAVDEYMTVFLVLMLAVCTISRYSDSRDWLISAFIGTQTFSVPTSSHNALISGWARFAYCSRWIEKEIKKREMLYLFP